MRSRRSYSYGCLMIKLPKPLADEVVGLAARIPGERLYRGNEDADSGRVMDPHVTLKYGITTFDDEEVERVVESVEPFEVAMGRCGVFHNDPDIVLKMSVQSVGLVALNKRVCLMMDTVSRYREYLPHVTIAYLKKDPMEPHFYHSLYDDRLAGQKFWVDQLHFSTPIGNKYVIPLNGERSKVARVVGSSERVAGLVLAGLDVRVSPMERKDLEIISRG